MTRMDWAMVLFGLIGVGVIWHSLWTHPRDQFVDEVMECTGPNFTQASWNACVKSVRAK